MPIPLRQSTASQEIPLGYFLDPSDGDTAVTGLTIANTDIKLWRQGATTLADKNSGGATHIAGGLYYTVLDATDTATLGGLVVFVHVSGALAVRVECTVLAANVYDALIAASDNLQVHTAEMSNDLITAAVIATGAIDADAIADNAIDAGAIAADAIAEINATVDTALADYDAPTNAEMTARTLAAADYATATAVGDLPTNAELATALGTADDAVLSAISGLNNLSAAQVNAEVVDVLSTDTFAELAAVPAATSSLKDKLTWLFMLARNARTQTETTQTLKADNGSTNVATQSSSDNGSTLTLSEFT